MHLHAYYIEALRASAWLLILCVIFIPLERLFAVHPQKILRRETVSDLGFYFLSSLSLPHLDAHRSARCCTGLCFLLSCLGKFIAAVAAWPLWQRGLSAFVVADLGFY